MEQSNPYIRNVSIAVLKKHLFKGMRPNPHQVYNVCKPIGLKLLTKLRLGLSDLNEHRFNHDFGNCVNPLCACSSRQKQALFFSCIAIIMLLDLHCLMSFLKLI